MTVGSSWPATWTTSGPDLALSGPAALVEALPKAGTVVHATQVGEHAGLLWRADRPPSDPRWAVRTPGVADIVLAYLRAPEVTALPRPTLVSPKESR